MVETRAVATMEQIQEVMKKQQANQKRLEEELKALRQNLQDMEKRISEKLDQLFGIQIQEDEVNQEQKPLSGTDHTTSPSVQQPAHDDELFDENTEKEEDEGGVANGDNDSSSLTRMEDDSVNKELHLSWTEKGDMNNALQVFDQISDKETSSNDKVPYSHRYFKLIIVHNVLDESSQKTRCFDTIVNNEKLGLKATYEHDRIAWLSNNKWELVLDRAIYVSVDIFSYKELFYRSDYEHAIAWDPGKHAYYEGSEGVGLYTDMINSSLADHLEMHTGSSFSDHRGINTYISSGFGGTNQKVQYSLRYLDLTTILKVFDVVFVSHIIEWKVIMNGYRNAHAKGGRWLYVHHGLESVLSKMISMEEPDMFVVECQAWVVAPSSGINIIFVTLELEKNGDKNKRLNVFIKFGTSTGQVFDQVRALDIWILYKHATKEMGDECSQWWNTLIKQGWLLGGVAFHDKLMRLLWNACDAFTGNLLNVGHGFETLPTTCLIPQIYNRSKEQQRVVGMNKTFYLLEKSVFKGGLIEKGLKVKVKKFAFFKVAKIYDHSLAIQLGGVTTVQIAIACGSACNGCISSAVTVMIEKQSSDEFLTYINKRKAIIVSVSPQWVVEFLKEGASISGVLHRWVLLMCREIFGPLKALLIPCLVVYMKPNQLADIPMGILVAIPGLNKHNGGMRSFPCSNEINKNKWVLKCTTSGSRVLFDSFEFA